MICITRNTVVHFRYIMKNHTDVVIENIMNGLPKCYLHGSTGILPSLQLQFEGLKKGEARLIKLTEENEFENEEFTSEIIIDEIRPASQEELMLGYPVSIDDLVCGEDCICNNE